jgi:hypothetical protein
MSKAELGQTTSRLRECCSSVVLHFSVSVFHCMLWQTGSIGGTSGVSKSLETSRACDVSKMGSISCRVLCDRSRCYITCKLLSGRHVWTSQMRVFLQVGLIEVWSHLLWWTSQSTNALNFQLIFRGYAVWTSAWKLTSLTGCLSPTCTSSLLMVL